MEYQTLGFADLFWELRGETRDSCGPCECRAGFNSPFSSPCIPALSAAGLNVTCSLVTSDLQALILLLVCRANALFLLALPSLQWGISIFWALSFSQIYELALHLESEVPSP